MQRLASVKTGGAAERGVLREAFLSSLSSRTRISLNRTMFGIRAAFFKMSVATILSMHSLPFKYPHIALLSEAHGIRGSEPSTKSTYMTLSQKSSGDRQATSLNKRDIRIDAFVLSQRLPPELRRRRRALAAKER